MRRPQVDAAQRWSAHYAEGRRQRYGEVVKEEAIISAVVKALLASLKKAYPDVIDDLRFVLGADKDGQDAVFVTVILKDRKTGDYRWEDVRPVEQVLSPTSIRTDRSKRCLVERAEALFADWQGLPNGPQPCGST